MNIIFTAPHKHLNLKDVTCSDNIIGSHWDAWICNPLKAVSGKDLDMFQNLRILGTPSTGTNHIDLEACEERGIKVISLLDNRPALQKIKASSEFTLFMILAGLRNGGYRMLKTYLRDDDIMRGSELSGKYVGFVGYGRIGKNVAKWVHSMGAKHDYYDPKYRNDYNLPALFKNCDIVVICAELNKITEGLIKKKHLDSMKPNALLVNSARAEIIDKKDLEEWCEAGGRYVTDVLHGEVNGEHINSSLLNQANVIIYPHIAGTTFESQKKAARIIIDLVKEKLCG